MKLLMYGAGNIGRGFIGLLFARAGYEVVFVDVNKPLVEAMNRRGVYTVKVAARPACDIPVTGACALDGTDREAVAEAIAACDIMATSLGASALERVSPIIAEGFARRVAVGGGPLDILICENLKDAAPKLRSWIKAALPETLYSRLDDLGLVETAIGRMTPLSESDDPLDVRAEEYDFLPVDKAAFRGPLPDVPQLVPYEPFAFYEERKLYLHNMGHAVCAYLGLRRDHETIAQAISDPVIRLLVQSAMTESAAMLCEKYGIPFARIFDHAEDLLLRFGNPALGDTCERVARDPLRKLQADDRLAGALCACREHGVYPVYIALGYALALRYITEDAERAEEIARETGKLPEEQSTLVTKLFAALTTPDPDLVKTAEQLKKELRGNIV